MLIRNVYCTLHVKKINIIDVSYVFYLSLGNNQIITGDKSLY